MVLEIVTREAWGAERSYRSWLLRYPVPFVFIVFTKKRLSVITKKYPPIRNDTLRVCCREMRYMQRGDQQQKLPIPDIRYNFMIGGDGRVYEGRGWLECPTLPKTYANINRLSILLGFIEKADKEKPTAAMFKTLHNLLVYGIRKNFIKSKYLEFSI